jgi:ribose transport system ATP-binding protein
VGPELGAAVALAARGIRKVYGGTVALAGADLTVHAGQIHALLGENGAGKSTFVRLLAAIEPTDGGGWEILGQPLTAHATPEDVGRAGVAFIHQQLGLIGDLSIAENVALVAGYPRRHGVIDWEATHEQARDAVARLGVDLDPNELVASLALSAQAVVAIARALAVDARVLVLDEPTANLTAGEVDTLFTSLRRLRDQGVAIVFISHRLDEVRALCDHVTVLRDGHVVGTSALADIHDDGIVELIVGRALNGVDRSAPAIDRQPVLRLDHVVAPGIGPLTLDLFSGEVTAVTGLGGSGHVALGGLLFGLVPVAGGRLTLNGQSYVPTSPRAAIAAGVASIPLDRNTNGAVPEMDLRENLAINPTVKWWKVLRRGRERDRAGATLRSFDVRPPEPDAAFVTLSGGNAQKVILARSLTGAPKMVIANEPTAAVDIGARRDIHARLRAAALGGAVVVVISSDMEEVEQMCDRAIVMRTGVIVAELRGADVTVANLTRAAYGHH